MYQLLDTQIKDSAFMLLTIYLYQLLCAYIHIQSCGLAAWAAQSWDSTSAFLVYLICIIPRPTVVVFTFMI